MAKNRTNEMGKIKRGSSRMNDIAVKQESTVTKIDPSMPAVIDPMQMIAQASANGAGADELGKLVDLFERIKAREDEMAFNKAKARFQSLCPILYKTKQGNNSKYAAYEDIMAIIQPLLTECGLIIDFNQKVGDVQGSIRVYCYIGLVDGTYRQENYMQSTADFSGSKKNNECQASASTTSYMQRYALKMALNLPIAGEDIDARIEPALLSKSSSLTNLIGPGEHYEPIPPLVVTPLKERLWLCDSLDQVLALQPEIEALNDKKFQQEMWKDFHELRKQHMG
jgi:hypothetical protein